MKKIFLSLMAMMLIVCTAVIVSCSKEQLADYTAHTKDSLKYNDIVANKSNPFDFCGRVHNEILDFIIQNNSHPSNEDIVYLTRQYLLEHYNMSSDLTFGSYSNGYNATVEFVLDAFLRNRSFHEIGFGNIVARTLDMLVGYSNAILATNILPTPQEYADYLIAKEKEIAKDREETVDSNDDVTEYDVSLGTLAIARYSYAYWYEVAHNPQNDWNYIKINSKKQDDDSKPGFWKRLWNGICDVAETVAKVVVTPVVDATGFAYGAVKNSGPVPPSSGVFGLDGNWLCPAVETAADWSGSIWE